MTDTEYTEQTPDKEDTVELHEAADADIDAFLATQEKAESTQSEDAEVEEAPAPEATEETPKKEAKPEAQDPAKPQAKQERSAESYEKQIRDKELFNQRQAYEIGQLRKQLKEQIAAKKAGLDERFLESPQQAIDDKLEIKEFEQQERELAERGRRVEAQALLERHIKPRPELPGAVMECLKLDGLDPAYIQQFDQDPFSVAQPGEVLQIAKRAETYLVAKELYGHVQTLLQELQKAKGQPERVLDQVDAALRAAPKLNGKSGQATSRGIGIDASQLSNMSDAELERYLAGSR